MVEGPKTCDEAGLIDDLRGLTTVLEGVGRAFQTREAKAIDRALADHFAFVTLRLAARVDRLARATRDLASRRLEGFAVGFFDPCNRRWYLHHAWSWGNLMRTPHIESAALWPTVEAVKEWAATLDGIRSTDARGKAILSPRDQLAGYTLHAFQAAPAVGASVHRFTVGDPMGGSRS